MSRVELTIPLLKFMKIPDLYFHCVLREIPDECPHKRILKRYIENIEINIAKGRGLYLWGNYGAGKTALSSILLKAAASYAQIGLWIRAPEIVKFYVENIRFNDEFTMLERALDVPILVIDELIIPEHATAQHTYIEDLIRQRINDRQSTIITSNIAPRILDNRYPALSAVMKECMLDVEISGYDFRAAKRKDIVKEMK